MLHCCRHCSARATWNIAATRGRLRWCCLRPTAHSIPSSSTGSGTTRFISAQNKRLDAHALTHLRTHAIARAISRHASTDRHARACECAYIHACTRRHTRIPPSRLALRWCNGTSQSVPPNLSTAGRRAQRHGACSNGRFDARCMHYHVYVVRRRICSVYAALQADQRRGKMHERVRDGFMEALWLDELCELVIREHFKPAAQRSVRQTSGFGLAINSISRGRSATSARGSLRRIPSSIPPHDSVAENRPNAIFHAISVWPPTRCPRPTPSLLINGLAGVR